MTASTPCHGRTIDVPSPVIPGAADRGTCQRPGDVDRMAQQARAAMRGVHLVPAPRPPPSGPPCNALTPRVVLERHPARSIRDIRSTGVPFDPGQFIGPWRARLITVKGRAMSLDDVEHGTMRPTFRDPRVHHAANCAPAGRPDLRPRAFRAATLEADLDDAARHNS